MSAPLLVNPPVFEITPPNVVGPAHAAVIRNPPLFIVPLIVVVPPAVVVMVGAAVLNVIFGAKLDVLLVSLFANAAAPPLSTNAFPVITHAPPPADSVIDLKLVPAVKSLSLVSWVEPENTRSSPATGVTSKLPVVCHLLSIPRPSQVLVDMA